MSQDLQRNLDDLLSGDLSRQAEAHERLLDLAEDPARREDVARRVVTLASHDDPQVRGTAYLVLATAQGRDCLSRLERHVEDPQPRARVDLAHAAAIVGPEGEALLRQLARDPAIEVRVEAASWLAEAGDNSGIAPLLEALDRPALRYQALNALLTLADPRALEPVRKLFKKLLFVSPFDRAAAAGVLARLGDAEARKWLVDRIGRRRGDERGLAIELAGELKIPEAVPRLRELIGRKGDLFRGAAAHALGMYGDDSACEPIEAVLLDERVDAETRLDAAEGLHALGTPRARRALEEAESKVEDPEVRRGVSECLAQLAKPAGVEEESR